MNASTSDLMCFNNSQSKLNPVFTDNAALIKQWHTTTVTTVGSQIVSYAITHCWHAHVVSFIEAMPCLPNILLATIEWDDADHARNTFYKLDLVLDMTSTFVRGTITLLA